MSSSEEQGLSASLLARANEAAKDPHLLWLGQKAPSPRQAAIICQILGLTNEEEKNVKAVAVLKRTWPFALQDLLQGKFFKASEAENKKEGEARMKAYLKKRKNQDVILHVAGGLPVVRGIVKKVCKEYVTIQQLNNNYAFGGSVDVFYHSIIAVSMVS